MMVEEAITGACNKITPCPPGTMPTIEQLAIVIFTVTLVMYILLKRK